MINLKEEGRRKKEEGRRKVRLVKIGYKADRNAYVTLPGSGGLS
ncbi:hypothetical protein QUB60_24465 [Microcoleus sp. A2-C5]|nr:hypothetical protein [Lyngbya sp. CCAP 1446/10]